MNLHCFNIQSSMFNFCFEFFGERPLYYRDYADDKEIIESIMFFLIDIDECQYGPCQHNSVCSNALGGYRCDCTQGWTGQNCESGKFKFCVQHMQYIIVFYWQEMDILLVSIE